MKLTTAKFIALGMTMLLPQLAADLHAAVWKSSQAKVRMIRNDVRFRSDKNAELETLRVNRKLEPGAVIECAKASRADLYFVEAGAVVRVEESTTLSLDKINNFRTHDEGVVQLELDLKSGTILGQGVKLAPASKFEVKIPNGVCSIRSTGYKISASGEVYVFSGEVRMTYTLPGGQPTTRTVKSGQVYHPPVAGSEPQIKKIDPNDPVWTEALQIIHFSAPTSDHQSEPLLEPIVKPSQQPAHSDGRSK
jgi:hypothetical protein